MRSFVKHYIRPFWILCPRQHLQTQESVTHKLSIPVRQYWFWWDSSIIWLFFIWSLNHYQCLFALTTRKLLLQMYELGSNDELDTTQKTEQSVQLIFEQFN